MGRSFESVRMGVKDVSARWLKASRALKKEDQVYGQRVAEMAKKHSSEAFYALDDPLEAAVFSVLVVLLRELGGGKKNRIMWIFDSYYKGCVELWGRERGLTKASAAYPPFFYMHLKDPPPHREMSEALESRFKAEECSFKTIFGTFPGHRIYAGRKVAEKIEIQTRYQAELYNVDVRQDQRYMAEHDIFPCGDRDESRFSPDFEIPLTNLINMHADI